MKAFSPFTCGSGFPAATVEAESLSHTSFPSGWRNAQ